jgi:hypothetical protein
VRPMFSCSLLDVSLSEGTLLPCGLGCVCGMHALVRYTNPKFLTVCLLETSPCVQAAIIRIIRHVASAA